MFQRIQFLFLFQKWTTKSNGWQLLNPSKVALSLQRDSSRFTCPNRHFGHLYVHNQMLCAHQVLPFQIILKGYFYNDSNSDNPFKAEKVCVCHHSSAEQRLRPTLASFNHQLCNRVSLQSIYLTITIYTCLHWINLAVYTSRDHSDKRCRCECNNEQLHWWHKYKTSHAPHDFTV